MVLPAEQHHERRFRCGAQYCADRRQLGVDEADIGPPSLVGLRIDVDDHVVPPPGSNLRAERPT